MLEYLLWLFSILCSNRLILIIYAIAGFFLQISRHSPIILIGIYQILIFSLFNFDAKRAKWTVSWLSEKRFQACFSESDYFATAWKAQTFCVVG
jgi:hypothetical protein